MNKSTNLRALKEAAGFQPGSECRSCRVVGEIFSFFTTEILHGNKRICEILLRPMITRRPQLKM